MSKINDRFITIFNHCKDTITISLPAESLTGSQFSQISRSELRSDHECVGQGTPRTVMVRRAQITTGER